MNHLQHETSPYLLQHAHNPVEWYAWKPEAFERARRENKPIILSIGYSTCHWCHVMERESFEDPDTAAFMNAHFINIKVDREERPDVDQIYMDACQSIHGGGGWPLNCFLLPDGRPYFAGTYYPPFPSDRRPSWLQLVNNMYRAYRDRRADAIDQADRLMKSIQSGKRVFRDESLLEQAQETLFQPELAEKIFTSLTQRFDTVHGGFGGAPKFPATMNLQFLLQYYHYAGASDALDHVRFSVQQMIRGGIYDQLGGGFARYTVDKAWLVPHFEKMLYDNALLVSLLADTYRTTKDSMVEGAIRETLTFIDRELSSPEGGFYSALDADTEGEEGKFYVWSVEEIREELQELAPLFEQVFGVSDGGNWEGHNILWRATPVQEAAEQLGLSIEEAEQQLTIAKSKLLARRSLRVRPGLDDKHLLSWNALMISAYCQAYSALGEESYRQRAHAAIRFVEEKMLNEQGRLWHAFKDGRAQYEGFLDDYAYWINALLDAYTLEFDLDFIDQAVTFTDFVLAEFLDESDNLFYFTAASQDDVPLRPKEVYDNAMPSGNAMMVHNLLRLAHLTGNEKWRSQAKRMVQPMLNSLEKYPTAFGHWALAALRLAYPEKELAIIGPEAERQGRVFLQQQYAGLVVMAHREGDISSFPLLAGRSASEETLFFICQDYQCQLPVRTREEAVALINSLPPNSN